MNSLGRTLRGESRDAAVFTASNFFNRFAGLLLLPIYWTALEPADYGVIAVIGVIGALQAPLSSLSLDLAITRFYYDWPPARRASNVGAVWVWSWIVTGGVTLIFLLAIPNLAPLVFRDVRDVSLLSLGVVANGLANLFIIPASTVRIIRLPWLFAAYNFLGFAISTGLGLWLVLVERSGVGGLLVAMIAAHLVLAAIGGLTMRRFAQPGLSSPDLAEAIRFSVRAVPAALINAVAQTLDRVFLGLFSTLETLGLYAIAMRFADMVGLLHVSLKMAFGPFMMRSLSVGSAGGRKLVSAVTPYYLIPYFVLGVGLALFAGPLVRWIGQPEYLGVGPLVPWLVGVTVLGSLYFYYCNGLFLAKRTELLGIPAVVHLAVLTTASALLIGPFQISGLIASRYIGAAALFGVSLYLSQRMYRFPHDWAALIRIATAAVLTVLVGTVLGPDSSPLEFVVRSAALLGFVALSLPLAGGRRASLRNAWRYLRLRDDDRGVVEPSDSSASS